MGGCVWKVVCQLFKLRQKYCSYKKVYYNRYTIAKTGESRSTDVVKNWLRNRNTLEF